MISTMRVGTTSTKLHMCEPIPKKKKLINIYTQTSWWKKAYYGNESPTHAQVSQKKEPPTKSISDKKKKVTNIATQEPPEGRKHNPCGPVPKVQPTPPKKTVYTCKFIAQKVEKQHQRMELYAWKKVRGDPKKFVKIYNGNVYHWCEFHRQWRLHKIHECSIGMEKLGKYGWKKARGDPLKGAKMVHGKVYYWCKYHHSWRIHKLHECDLYHNKMMKQQQQEQQDLRVGDVKSDRGV